VELIANRDKSTFSAADGHGWRRCDEASSAEVGLPDAAERIFEKAEILANQGKHAEALDRFREGLKIQALHLQPRRATLQHAHYGISTYSMAIRNARHAHDMHRAASQHAQCNIRQAAFFSALDERLTATLLRIGVMYRNLCELEAALGTLAHARAHLYAPQLHRLQHAICRTVLQQARLAMRFASASASTSRSSCHLSRISS
jgi:tetratricopeptide (TPR) repeat protein